MTPNVVSLPAEGRRGISRRMYDPLTKVECISRQWGIF